MLIFGCNDTKELISRLKVAKDEEDRVDFIVFSGNKHECDIFKSIYQTKLKVYMDCESQNTIQNVINSMKLFNKQDIKVIVSSAYHLRRIRYILQVLYPDRMNGIKYYGALDYSANRYIMEKDIEDKHDMYKSLILQGLSPSWRNTPTSLGSMNCTSL